MGAPNFTLAILWDGTALPRAVDRVLEELASRFESSIVSNLALTLSPSMACLHFSVDFSAYARATMNQLEIETKKSGGRFIELLRIPEDKRESFKTQFLLPAHGSPQACNSFKECAQPLLAHLAKLAPVGASAPVVQPTPARHAAANKRKAPRFDVNLQVEFQTEADFVREHATNISKGGLFVQTTQRPKLNSELELRLRLPNGQTLETFARVVHILDQPNVGGVGLAFSRDDPDFSAAIEQYIAHLQKR